MGDRLLAVHEGRLIAHGFDPKRLRLTGALRRSPIKSVRLRLPDLLLFRRRIPGRWFTRVGVGKPSTRSVQPRRQTVWQRRTARRVPRAGAYTRRQTGRRSPREPANENDGYLDL